MTDSGNYKPIESSDSILLQSVSSLTHWKSGTHPCSPV